MVHVRTVIFCLFVPLFLVIDAGVPPASAADCSASTYGSTQFRETQARFSPYEKVFVQISCRDLPVGAYVMHVNWVHKKRGMIRSDKQEFQMEMSGDRSVYFWFKLTQKGPFSSVITSSDFHEENFGEWVVETYLNEDKVFENDFAIEDGTPL